MLICGASAYPRDWDYARLRKIADKQGAYLMADIAHISGLVAAKVQNNPFEYCDVVTTTTYVRAQIVAVAVVECPRESARGKYSDCALTFL